jgi:hypothetical protein
MDRRTFRRLIFGALVLAVALRLIFSLGYWTGKPLTHDEREYLALATSIADGRGFTYPDDHATGTGQRFSRAPGYAVFLAALGARQSEATPRRVQIVQGALGTLVVWLIAALARRAAGTRASVVAAYVAASYPPLVWLSSYVFSEALYMPLALGCILLLDMIGNPSREETDRWNPWWMTVAAGVLAGTAALVRSAMTAFLPLAALWLIYRGRLRHAVLLGVVVALIVVPWGIRNLNTHGRLILVAADGGVTFWTGNHPLAIGEGDLAANPQIKREEILFRQAHPGLTAEQLEPLYYQDAMRHITNHPGWWLALLARKLFYTFVPIGPSYTLHSTKYLIATVVPYAVLLPFAVVGVGRLIRQGHVVPLLLLALSSVITAVLFLPQERFRIPAVDPTAIICAATVLARRSQTS